jgi:hypothetical protein
VIGPQAVVEELSQQAAPAPVLAWIRQHPGSKCGQIRLTIPRSISSIRALLMSWPGGRRPHRF